MGVSKRWVPHPSAVCALGWDSTSADAKCFEDDLLFAGSKKRFLAALKNDKRAYDTLQLNEL
jgi:hypothetical protein